MFLIVLIMNYTPEIGIGFGRMFENKFIISCSSVCVCVCVCACAHGSAQAVVVCVIIGRSQLESILKQPLETCLVTKLHADSPPPLRQTS